MPVATVMVLLLVALFLALPIGTAPYNRSDTSVYMKYGRRYDVRLLHSSSSASHSLLCHQNKRKCGAKQRSPV